MLAGCRSEMGNGFAFLKLKRERQHQPEQMSYEIHLARTRNVFFFHLHFLFSCLHLDLRLCCVCPSLHFFFHRLFCQRRDNRSQRCKVFPFSSVDSFLCFLHLSNKFEMKKEKDKYGENAQERMRKQVCWMYEWVIWTYYRGLVRYMHKCIPEGNVGVLGAHWKQHLMHQKCTRARTPGHLAF